MEIKDIIPGRQYMVRKYQTSRAVRVEIESVDQYEGMRTVIVRGRYIRRGHQPGYTVVGSTRTWSTYPELIEAVDQI